MPCAKRSILQAAIDLVRDSWYRRRQCPIDFKIEINRQLNLLLRREIQMHQSELADRCPVNECER